MFLFAHKTKTPISTYTESYRPPGTVKQTYREPPFTLLEENKFITEGLTVPRVENQVNQAHLEKMIKHAVQDYSYKNTIEPTAYRPEKYWVTRPEGILNYLGDKYATWRTGPYNSAGWNKYTTYLPRLPQEAGMETILRGMPMQYPPKPDRLNNYEREVVVNMLNSLSRSQLPSVQHRSTIPGRKPFQGYSSPCTGRHYCLRGMDYYVDGAPCNERALPRPFAKDRHLPPASRRTPPSPPRIPGIRSPSHSFFSPYCQPRMFKNHESGTAKIGFKMVR
uniref:Chromosome 9 open reading frame 24 n=1 Tax=Chelydra serpentina TaxID=8475 RepID=A0A8C3STS9_CHESE